MNMEISEPYVPFWYSFVAVEKMRRRRRFEEKRLHKRFGGINAEAKRQHI